MSSVTDDGKFDVERTGESFYFLAEKHAEEIVRKVERHIFAVNDRA